MGFGGADSLREVGIGDTGWAAIYEVRHACGVENWLIRWVRSDEIQCKCSASVLELET